VRRAEHTRPALRPMPGPPRTVKPRRSSSRCSTAERHAALREAFARLPPCCQQLITLLIQDPPLPYATISARLNIPIGSIGPNRSRCLDRLRRDPAIAALISAAADPARSEPPDKRLHRHDQQPKAS
jgi:DNA-directed RNA polymerase specialized sigma24 family protein